MQISTRYDCFRLCAIPNFSVYLDRVDLAISLMHCFSNSNDWRLTKMRVIRIIRSVRIFQFVRDIEVYIRLFICGGRD
jgi:hypothetical protein